MLSTHDYVGDITPLQKELCEMVRAKFKDIEDLLNATPGAGTRSFSDRCINIAKTHLETASMYTIKGIVFEGKEVG